jgi:flagellin
MSLGVLNNLSAIYAENNLNNTNNSLNTVLQQLSSGSKINSGADDAAGLSLVDGLQANSMALAQSQTNASEGVGLLRVADGALSQVTNLLNRAVTLATEASNGTLNSSQDTAANQEYQSILSEINNIGTTTTYNNQTVFGAASAVNIYTGDSSTAGSSIDSLNIQSLSSSNVGDTGGVMAYSNGSSNVFLNLSSSTANAALTDTLNSTTGKTNLAVNYLVKGANGSSTSASTTITVGTGTNYANTAGGLISAINNAGLGLNATFATQAEAGVQGGGTQTGIEISGGLVSAGVDPNASSTSGTLDLSGLAPGATLALGATVTVNQGSNSHTFTIDSSNNTLANLATAISGQSSLAVTASVVTNGDGTQSLSLADTGPTGGALSVTTTAGTTQAPAFGTGTTGTTQNVQTQGTTVTGVSLTPAAVSTIVVGTGGTDSATEQLTEGTSITITNSIPSDAQTQTFVIGNGTDVNGATGTHYTGNAGMGTGGNTLATLADTINAQSATLGVYATVGASGLTVTTGTYVSGTAEAGNIVATNTTLGGETVAVTANTLTAATTSGAGSTKLGLYSPTIGGTAAGGSPTVTVLDTGSAAVQTDVLTGTFTLSNPLSGGPVSFTMNGTTDTWTTLMNDINGSQGAALGVSASWGAAEAGGGKGGLVLTSTTNGVNTITVGGAGISDGGHAIVNDATGVGHAAGVAGNSFGTASTAILQLGTGNITDTGMGASTLGGAINISYGGTNQVFIVGSDPGSASSLHVASAIYTGGTSVTSLINAINASAIGGVTNNLYAQGVTASDPGGGTGGIYLQGAIGTATPFALTTVNPAGGTETPLAVTTAVTVGGSGTATGTGSTAATGVAAVKAVDNVTANGIALATSDTMAGHITVSNGGTSNIFVIGSGSNSAVAGTFYTNNTDGGGTNYGNTLAGLAAAITALSTNGVSAQANTSGLTLTQNTAATGSITTSNNTLTDVTMGSYSTSTTTNQLASESDRLSGALVFNVGSGATQTVTMANVTASGTYAATAQGLINYIHANQSTLGVDATWVPAGGSSPFGSIRLTSGTQGASGTVNVSSTLTNLVDTTGGAALTYTSNSAYNTGISSGTNTVFDSTAGQTSSVASTFVSDTRASSGVATISYTDGAGQSLSATNLSNQTNAEAALTALNTAITDVAAQDGYVGAQINTLNAVSSVLSTQQENVTSAQNAVQATDYASAASNMSKYEILSQTGISALAQANSMQQEVTKLLQ